MENTLEKRMQPRFLYKSYASYMKMGDVCNLPDLCYSMAEILDISGGGLRLRLPQPLVNEETLMITKIPLSGISATLPVFVKVQWVKAESENTCIAGLQFVLGN